MGREDLFGRPVTWEKNGTALDLARRLNSTKVIKATFLGRPDSKGRVVMIGEDWAVNPEDFLGRWEVLSAEDLAKETVGTEAGSIPA
jgi:hypothetical protein